MKSTNILAILMSLFSIGIMLASGLQFTASTGGSNGASSVTACYGGTIDDYVNGHFKLKPDDGTLSFVHSGSGNLPLVSISTSDCRGNFASVSRSVLGKPRITTWSYDWGTSRVRSSSEGLGVNAWLTMNVNNAYSISGSALSINRAGDIAYVDTYVDSAGLAPTSSLSNYKATANAFQGLVTADQSFGRAAGNTIATDSAAYSLSRFELQSEKVSTQVAKGSISDYNSHASASASNSAASQSFDAATGTSIRTVTTTASQSLADLLCHRRNSGIETSVTTTASGSVTDYEDLAFKSDSTDKAVQNAHIKGTFVSTSTADTETKTRTSDYGTDYDLNMQALKDSTGSYATGTLGYYVKPEMAGLISGKGAIQGAVDTAEAGDTVNAAAGIYRENVVLEKSLTLAGTGRGDDSSSNTIITAANAVKPVIDINTGGVVVKNLQVTGANTYLDYDRGAGIAIRGTEDIDGVTLQNIASKDNFYGLNILASGNAISNIDANGMIISDSSETGVFAAAIGSGSSISNLNLNGAEISNSGDNGVTAYAAFDGSISNLDLGGAKISNSDSNGVYARAFNHGSISNLDLGGTKISNSGSNGVCAVVGIHSSVSDLNLMDAQISNSGINGAYAEVGIDGSLSNLNLNGAKISGSVKNGVDLYALSNGIISNLNLNSAQISDSGQNGVRARAGSRSSISNLDLRGATISRSIQDGVYIDAETGSSISDLDLRGATISNSGGNGVFAKAYDISAGISNLDLSGATISSSGLDGMKVYADYDASISNLNLNGAQISNSGGDGMDLIAVNDGTISNAAMYGGTITGSGHSGLWCSGAVSGVVLNNVNIYGNNVNNDGGLGVDNEASSYIDARYNWWGTGGSGEPGADGNNGVSGNVNYNPWQTSQIT